MIVNKNCRIFKYYLFIFLINCYVIVTTAQKHCHSGCSLHGTCNLELGRCDCPWNFTGPACDATHKGFCLVIESPDNPINTCTDGNLTLCVNSCNKRGSCKGGFCHCFEGFFGTDCSLSYGLPASTAKAGAGSLALTRSSSPGSPAVPDILAGLPYRPSSRGPRIYVYDLPPEFHVKLNIHRMDRAPQHIALYERILSGGYRTADGAAADFFFVPASTRYLKQGQALSRLFDYIATAWPFWNATGGEGQRHIMLSEGDVGACEIPLGVRERAKKLSWLQFWGLYGKHPAWSHVIVRNLPCMVPGRDIVIPFMAMSSHDRYVVRTPLHPGNANRLGPRNATLFFAGAICGSGRYDNLPPKCTRKGRRYSGGVRQVVYLAHRHRPGFKIRLGSKDYATDYSSAKYCLAAAGGGWGKRGVVGTLFGCVPVAATDFVYEAFEPEMNWARFGVRVNQSDLPRLHKIIEAIPPDRFLEMQRRTACAAQHFHWSGSLGGIMAETGRFDAFETIMAILRVRKAHPDLDPKLYYDQVEQFRKFADCEVENQTETSRGLPTSRRALLNQITYNGMNSSMTDKSDESNSISNSISNSDNGSNQSERRSRVGGRGGSKGAALGIDPDGEPGPGSARRSSAHEEGVDIVKTRKSLLRNGFVDGNETSSRTSYGSGRQGDQVAVGIRGGNGLSVVRRLVSEALAPLGPPNSSDGRPIAVMQPYPPTVYSLDPAAPLCRMFIGHFMHEDSMHDACPTARYYFRRKIGPPGGAVCVGAPDLTRCRRFD